MAPRAPLVYLDTHVVVWLYGGLTERISKRAVSLIEKGELLISPMVELELAYLHEVGRITHKRDLIVQMLAAEIGLKRGEVAFQQIVFEACTLDWTRDPFDRLIVAEALVAGASLISKDRSILTNCSSAVW